MPWTVGVYHSKRAKHITTPLGEIVGEEANLENILEPMGFDDEGKVRFACMVVGDELGVEESEVATRMESLFALVPGLKDRVRDIKVADLARLVVRVPDAAAKMVALKTILPETDLAKLLAARPTLLLEETAVLERQIEEFREALPLLRVDFILEDFPAWFEHKSPKASVAKLCEALNVDAEGAQKVLGANPSRLMMVQSGDDLIIYDNGSRAQVKASLSGGPGAAPDGW